MEGFEPVLQGSLKQRNELTNLKVDGWKMMIVMAGVPFCWRTP